MTQQCKESLILHVHGNTEHFYVVESYIYANNNIMGRYCCFHSNNAYPNAPQCNVYYIICLMSVFVCKREKYKKLQKSTNAHKTTTNHM